MRRYKNLPKARYLFGMCALIAYAALTITTTITVNVFFTGNDLAAIVSINCNSENYSKETLLKVMRCDLALMTTGAYQAHILGENFLVIITTIAVYVVALVKARRSGNIRIIAL